MRTRLTIALLGLLTSVLVNGCGTNMSSTPNVLVLTYYSPTSTQQWTIRNTPIVVQLYNQAKALPQVFATSKMLPSFAWEYVFKHDNAVVLQIKPSENDYLVIAGTLRERDPAFITLTNQAICNQTPSSMFCAQSSMTPTP